MSSTVIETQPKGTPLPVDHGERSMDDIADDYFSTINPIGRKIIAEKRLCMDTHRRDWDRLTQKEKDSTLDEWLIDPKQQLRYELKLGKKASPVAIGYPRYKVDSGGKMVHHSEQEDSSQTQSKETVSWKDEFSGPFCWETKCQQELTILTPETIPASSVPSPSISHDLIKVTDTAEETDAEWFAKSSKDKNKLSVMLMRDLNNRNSLGNNLLASSSERLAFDQAVGTALTGKSGTALAVTGKPGTGLAVTGKPGTALAVTGKPGTALAVTGKPGTALAVTGKPGTALAVTGKPGTAKPGTVLATTAKPKPKEKAATNSIGGSDRRPSQESLEKKKKKPVKPEGADKPKAGPPVSLKPCGGSKDSLIKDVDKKSGSAGKVKEKREASAKTNEVASARRDSNSKAGGIVSAPRKDPGAKGIGLASPRRDSSSKKGEKKQLLPPGLLTELKQELKVQDNVNFDHGKQQKEEAGRGPAELAEGEENPEMGEAQSYEFLFDW